MFSLGASVISILHSLGILALMAIGISMLQPSRFNGRTGWRRSLLMGLVFGATVSVVMIDPVTLPPGATFDARGAPALLAGIYGGPIAAVVAAVMGALTRVAIGGAGTVGGVFSLAVYAAVSIAAGVHINRRGARPGIPWLFGYALIGTVCALPSFLFFADLQTGLAVLSQAWWMPLSCNVVGVLVLGFLLEQDLRRRRLELDLRDTEERTRTAAEAKTRFLASMSHEIRTPMNAVVGFVDLLRDSRLDSFQRRCTNQAHDAACGLLRIIDDILDYAKIDAGRVTIDAQPTDVTALVKGCSEMLMLQIESKGLACSVDVDERLPASLETDPVRLRQILLNLLGNAIKFTDSGQIALGVRYEPGAGSAPGELTITVCDTGIGMTPDERDRLFSPFVQGDHIGRGGTGLGLVISRMLVTAMGGDLTLQSVSNEGTTVTLRLPMSPAVSPLPAATPAPAATPRAASLRILVAEDVALNAEMLQYTLEQAGHAVHIVPDGRQAVDAVNEQSFDIVLMDVQMPVMDGLEATRAIRAAASAKASTPIIALTAYASQDDLRICLDAGMNDFLTKPLERAKLHQTLARWSSGTESDAVPAAARIADIKPVGGSKPVAPARAASGG